MKEIPAVSHLLVLLDDQACAHTYEQQKGTGSRWFFFNVVHMYEQCRGRTEHGL